MEGRGVRLRTQGLAKLVEDMRVIKAPFPVGVKPGHGASSCMTVLPPKAKVDLRSSYVVDANQRAIR